MVSGPDGVTDDSRNAPAPSKRRHHKKTRTGCVTCKIRRVKCDEQKPACRRCVSTGRKCDGYEAHFDPTQERSGHDALIVFRVPQSPPRPVPQHKTNLEFRSLEYFQYRTLPTLCGCHDSGAWTSLLVQVSESEPAITHAMVALSAFHERCETVGVPLLEDQNSFSHPTSSDAFALRQYTKAIQLLRHRLTYGEQSHLVTLLSCVLFICLEFLRGNKDSAITHLRGGLDIIRSRLPSAPPTNHLQTNLTPSDILEGNLVPLFARLSVLQSLYGQPRSSNYGPSAHGPFLELLDVEVGPSRSFFDDLNEARVSAVNIINSTFRFAFMIDYGYFPSEDVMWATQSALLAQSQGWSDAMDVLTTTLSDEELPYAHLLSAHNYMTRVWMLSAPERTQCAFDSHLETFERIHDLCLPLISHLEGASSKRPSFTLDAGLLSTLFFASTKCRHRVQRRKFITLMQRAPVREGLWNAAEVLKVAEKCVGVEEEPISSEPSVMYPPELSRIHDMDIQSRSIEDPGRQFVRLKMKPLGLDHEFVWRTEHIKW